jgi:hypothetical protein
MNIPDMFSSACENVADFKTLLRQLRSEKLTQDGLGMKIGRAASFISDLENPAKPLPPSFRASDVRRIAEVLLCTPGETAALLDAYFCARARQDIDS